MLIPSISTYDIQLIVRHHIWCTLDIIVQLWFPAATLAGALRRPGRLGGTAPVPSDGERLYNIVKGFPVSLSLSLSLYIYIVLCIYIYIYVYMYTQILSFTISLIMQGCPFYWMGPFLRWEDSPRRRRGFWQGLSIRVDRAYPLVEIWQTALCRAIRGNSISVSSTLSPSQSLLLLVCRAGARYYAVAWVLLSSGAPRAKPPAPAQAREAGANEKKGLLALNLVIANTTTTTTNNNNNNNDNDNNYNNKIIYYTNDINNDSSNKRRLRNNVWLQLQWLQLQC